MSLIFVQHIHITWSKNVTRNLAIANRTRYAGTQYCTFSEHILFYKMLDLEFFKIAEMTFNVTEGY